MTGKQVGERLLEGAGEEEMRETRNSTFVGKPIIMKPDSLMANLFQKQKYRPVETAYQVKTVDI